MIAAETRAKILAKFPHLGQGATDKQIASAVLLADVSFLGALEVWELAKLAPRSLEPKRGPGRPRIHPEGEPAGQPEFRARLPVALKAWCDANREKAKAALEQAARADGVEI